MIKQTCERCGYELSKEDFENPNLHGHCLDGDIICPRCGGDTGWGKW